MSEFVSQSLEDTKNIAREFAKVIKPGMVVCMSGDLGAGKTTFVSALAEVLGIEAQVMSPTFNILMQYPNKGGPSINHFDLYRLDDEQELEDIDFFGIIEQDDITFIEWANKFEDAMPSDSVNFRIEKLDESSRKFIW